MTLTKQDLAAALKSALKDVTTKGDLKGFATKDDLKGFATKDDLKGFATKDDLKGIRDELKSFATKDEVKKIVFDATKDLATKNELATVGDRLETVIHDAVTDLKEDVKVNKEYIDQAFLRLGDRLISELDINERVTRIETHLGIIVR